MFCNPKTKKIRVSASELKTVFNSINCEFFCRYYRFPTISNVTFFGKTYTLFVRKLKDS